MILTVVKKSKERESTDLIILPFWKEKKGAKAACDLREFTPFFSPPIEQGDFLGKEGETLLLYPAKKKEKRLLLLGLGQQKECHDELLRRSYGGALKLCGQKKLKTIAVFFPENGNAVAAVEGMLLANYAFDSLKTKKEEASSLLQKICLIGIGEATFQKCKRIVQITEAVNFTRDLVNGNADDVTPEALAQASLDLAKKFSAIRTTVFDKKQIEKEKMELLLAVNRSSDKEPRFVVMEYKGNPTSSDLVAIVGKGITYDTGGLHLKSKGMETMKEDMSGAAIVLGVMRAVASLRLKVNLLGVFPATENGIGPKSYKPGDVYKSYNGKTVEITSTDGEGRLVLADALSYIQDKYAPRQIIDIATLTGGIVVALGDEASGLFSNDDKLADALVRCGERTGEHLWRFPLYSEYKELLKSSIADVKNSGLDRRAQPILGAIFLEYFIKKVSWAHIDIGGTSFLSVPRRYHTTNATGVGVRFLIEFLSHEA